MDDDIYLGPWHDRDPDEPPDLEEDDYARAMYDPNSGEWLDA